MSNSSGGSEPMAGRLRLRAMFRGTGGYGMIRCRNVDPRRLAEFSALNNGTGLEVVSGFTQFTQEVEGHAGKN